MIMYVGLLIVRLCFISDILLICSAVWLPVCLINLLTYPQDGTVSVIVLFTIVSSCVTDCNLLYSKVPL